MELTNASRRIQRAKSLQLLLVLIGMCGCKTGPSHPPTFADFQRAFRQGSESSAAVDAQVAVFAAAQLSKREMQIIFARGKAEELIGAESQAAPRDAMGSNERMHKGVGDFVSPWRKLARAFATRQSCDGETKAHQQGRSVIDAISGDRSSR